jgi:hypothetical protein
MAISATNAKSSKVGCSSRSSLLSPALPGSSLPPCLHFMRGLSDFLDHSLPTLLVAGRFDWISNLVLYLPLLEFQQEFSVWILSEF